MPATYRSALRIALLGATIGCGNSSQAPGTSRGPGVGVWKTLASAPAAEDETSLTPPQLFWTGSEVLLASGGTVSTYDPKADAWSVGPDPGAFGIVGASVWTGSMVISFGGQGCPAVNCTSSTGGQYVSASKYDPATSTFSAISTVGAPESRTNDAMLWTGSKVLVWGGDAIVPNPDGGAVGIVTGYNDGGLYDPATDSWMTFSGTADSAPRDEESVVWTGTEMIVWGGQLLTPGLNPPPMATNGVAFRPDTDAWSTLATAGQPSARGGHVAVWTGSEMIVWGGGPIDANGNFSVALADGAAYDPRSDTWRSIHLAPDGLIAGAAVWTGTQMIVWGGSDSQGPTTRGYAYDPATDAWSTLTTDGAPGARVDFAAVWTGQSLVIWGGTEDDTSIPFTPNDGAAWFPMASPGIGDGGFGAGD